MIKWKPAMLNSYIGKAMMTCRGEPFWFRDYGNKWVVEMYDEYEMLMRRTEFFVSSDFCDWLNQVEAGEEGR